MNSLKAFVTKNKLLVSITGAVTMCAFMVFSIIAFAIGGTGSTPSSTETNTTTSNLVADNSNQTSGNDVTLPPYTGEDNTAGEETTPGEVEIPTTTKPPVNPDTLPYEIRVNRVANFLTVYTKDAKGKFTVPYKAITVSCGKNLEDTPLGTYQTIEHYKWRKMNDGTYAQYAYRIVGPILFHSVPYYTQAKNDLEWEEYNKLGSPASMGCVRMTVIDAKWLMDNCPIGTRVVIYDDINEVPPLGKPDTIKIPDNLASTLGVTPEEAEELKKWDPTDLEPANPWHKYHATITSPAQVEITEGSSIKDLRSHFKATDTCGNDISYKIEFSGVFDLNVPGTYELTVSVEDAIGSKAEIKTYLFVTVKPTEPSSDEPSSEEPSSEEPSSDEPSESESDSSSESESNNSSETESDSSSSEETTTPSESTTPSETPSENTSDEESQSSSEINTTTKNEENSSKQEETTPKKDNKEQPKKNNSHVE